jgi:hypothetical protein
VTGIGVETTNPTVSERKVSRSILGEKWNPKRGMLLTSSLELMRHQTLLS